MAGSKQMQVEARESFVDVTEDSFVDETKDSFVDETKDSFVDETKDSFVDETKDSFVDETKDRFVDETKGGFVDENKDRFVVSKSRVLLSVLFIVCVLNSMLVLLSVVLHNDTTKAVVKDDSLQLCVPCIDISLHYDQNFYNMAGFDVTFRDNQEAICCTRNASFIVYLKSQRMARVRLAEDGAAHDKSPLICAKELKYPSGYLVGQVARLSDRQEDDLQVVQWSHEQEDQGSYLNPGVSFENGKFSMNETKFVFVYSQIGFSTRHSEGESCYFSHSLYRNRNGRNCSSCLERLLAFNSNLCSPDRQDGVQSSHLASSLYLDQHDEVLVRVSHPWRLVNNSGLNVFGIHT